MASAELLRGVLDLCLLAVIAEGPANGYEMTKRLRECGLGIVGEGSVGRGGWATGCYQSGVAGLR